ncbi:regulator [Robbsia sp. Bb-Pol-6]|uniref:Regulator n=1 Tax=Robbsia betulipollinis TaxID=2981849 RepID=A0ABT3ZMU5_9BURK|nr:regulator [Robbsia betulipollinis]MCY0387866.1 regulator [Robbsia betulipollinis]
MHEPTLHFLLPFALPAAQEGAAVLPARATPGLDQLVRRATLRERVPGEDFQRSLPHEQWLAARHGIAVPDGGDTPLAPYMLLADGGAPGRATWACLQPAHVAVTHDHLVLLDPDTLALDDADARALIAQAQASFDERGLTLVAPTPLRWYVSGDALRELDGAAPLRAIGRSIDIWLPLARATGARSRPWMSLQNEIQMAWHEHPVNEARERRGQLAVNTVWLHGQGALAEPDGPAHPARDASSDASSEPALARAFDTLYSDACATRGLGLATRAGVAPLPPTFAALLTGMTGAAATRASARPGDGPVPRPADPRALPILIEIGGLAAAFVNQDWGDWLARLADIDAQWFTPALQALRDGRVGRLHLTLGSDTGTVTLTVTRGDLKKFWRRRTLLSLLAGTADVMAADATAAPPATPSAHP